MKIAILLTCLVLLAGCGADRTIPTSEENRQLDDASAMLNEAPANLEAVDDSGLGSADANEAP